LTCAAVALIATMPSVGNLRPSVMPVRGEHAQVRVGEAGAAVLNATMTVPNGGGRRGEAILVLSEGPMTAASASVWATRQHPRMREAAAPSGSSW